MALTLRFARRAVTAAICASVDWLDSPRISGAYQHDGTWWQRNPAGWAQVVWFVAHNNRLYQWATTDEPAPR